MKAFFKSDLFFKIMSVVAAAVLWLYVVQFENPEFRISVSDIPVKFENESYLADKNLMITSQNKDSVSLNIKGKRQTVSELDKSGILAVIDLRTVTSPGEYNLPVKVSFSETGLSVTDSTMPRIKISVENKVHYEHTVKLKTIGEVKEGYYAVLDDASVKVSVISPESSAHLVTSARAVLDITNADATVEKSVPVNLYDENGNPVKSRLIKCEPENAAVRCFIYPTKEVPLVWKEIGVLPENASRLIPSATTVTIAGPEGVLEGIDNVNLGEIDVSAFTPLKDSKVFSLENILSLEDVYIVDEEKTVVMKTEFSRPQQPEFNEDDDSEAVSYADLTITEFSLEGVPQGYNAEVLTSRITVKVSGGEDEISGIKASDVSVSVDLTQLSADELTKTEHELPVIITSSKNIHVEETKYVKVRITPSEVEEATEQE